MPQIVAVFDTSILFSAVGWVGNPFQCLALTRNGSVGSVTCLEILAELTGKLHSKRRLPPDEVQDAIEDLRRISRIVEITHTLRVVTADPDDDIVIECAVVGGATHIVTGDKRHLLPLGSYQGIRIVSAAEFLKQVAMT